MKSITLLALALGLIAQVQAFSQYRIVETPIVFGSPAYIRGVNGNNRIYATTSGKMAFWSPATGYVDIVNPDPTLTVAPTWDISRVSSTGVVTGYSNSQHHGTRPFSWSVASGFNDNYVPVFGPGVSYLDVDANEVGQIVGTGFSGISDMDDILWSPDGTATVMPPMRSVAMNNHGDVVGFGNSGGLLRKADGTYVNLTGPNGSLFYSADDINDSGVILGLGTNGFGEDILWDSRGRVLKRRARTAANKARGNQSYINNSGLIATVMGPNSQDARIHLWTINDNPVSIDSLLDPASLSMGYTLVDVLDLDDSGQMIGYAPGPDGSFNTVLLQPVPEPATLGVLALGALPLLKRRKQRCVDPLFTGTTRPTTP